MSDAWEEIQAIKSKRNSLREKLQKRKKERQDILNLSGVSSGMYRDSTMIYINYLFLLYIGVTYYSENRFVDF